MKHIKIFFVFALFVTIGVGCNPEHPLSPPPRVWIDAPQQNAELPNAPLEVVSHATDPLHVPRVEFSVDGAAIHTETEIDSSKELVTVKQPWSPPGPGNYRLGVRAMNMEGVWSEPVEVLVTISGETQGGIVQGAVYADLNADAQVGGDSTLDGVTVTLSGCATKTTTTAGGNFKFEGLPAGSCLVSVAKSGWKFSGTYPAGIGYPAKAASNPGTPTAFSIFMTPDTPPPPPPPTVQGITPTVLPPVTIRFFADQLNLTSGNCTTLHWEVTNASSVSLDNAPVAAKGTKQVCPKTSTKYVLGIVTLDKQTTNRGISIVVTAAPAGCTGTPSIASFTASPSTISSGGSATLKWGPVTNADAIEISNGIGAVAKSGSKSVSPTSTTTYVLTARCGSKTATRQATVSVSTSQPPPPLPPPPAGCSGTPNISSFTASSPSITRGQSTTLSWGAVTNADSVEIQPDIGGVGTPGSRQVSPQQMTTYTLTARCGSRTATRQVTITVLAPPPPPPPRCTGAPVISSFTASPSSILYGQSSTLSWGAVTNADSISIDQGIGTVSAPGSRSVSPRSTTTYTLSARCGSTTSTRRVTVSVSAIYNPPK